jgi:hypothetical protein
MTNDPRDSPRPLRAVTILYSTLLEQYIQNRKELEDRYEKAAYRAIKNFLMRRKQVADPIPSPFEEGVGFRAGTIDFFGAYMKYYGAMEVLESLSTLDVSTLAALVEINRINLVRIERRLLFRRFVSLLIVAIPVVATLSKPIAFSKVLSNPDVIFFSRVLGELLFRWWQLLMYVAALGGVVLIEVLMRPAKERAEEFGEMLAVAFAYVSKLPSSKGGKGKEATENVHASEE